MLCHILSNECILAEKNPQNFRKATVFTYFSWILLIWGTAFREIVHIWKWGSWGSTEGTVEVFEKPVWKQAHLCHRKYLLLFKNEPDQWSDHIRRHILELSGLLRQSVSWKDKPTALSNQPHLSPNGSVINRLACAGRHIVNGLLK